MPSAPYRPVIDVILTDQSVSAVAARADYARAARRLAALLAEVETLAGEPTVEELAPLEAQAWELARTLSFAVGRIAGAESARAFVVTSVTQQTAESNVVNPTVVDSARRVPLQAGETTSRADV